MSISDQITRLQNAKASIKTSIENKGVTVPDDAKLDAFPALIDDIQAGGSGEIHINPDFYEFRTNNGTDYSYLFYGFGFGKSIDFSNWDMSAVTTMYHMFGNSSLSFTGFDKCDTSNVTSMEGMFAGAGYSSLDLSGLDTSNVTNMNYMLSQCYNLKSLDVSMLNVSNVRNMSSMFYYDTGLVSLNISGWDTSNATDMDGMFNGCRYLTTITGELDLSNLTNGFYNASYYNPLNGCTALETLYLKNIYKNCTMTNASKWSINLGDTKVKDECLIYIINELPDLVNNKGLTNTSYIILTLPKTNTLTAEQVQPAIDKGWTVANTTY